MADLAAPHWKLTSLEIDAMVDHMTADIAQ